MKRIFKYLAAALAAGALLASCANDPAAENLPIKGTDVEGGRKTITFTIPSANRDVVSYSVTTEDGEANLDHLDIYMFDDAKGTLEWIFKNDDINLVNNATDNNATIDVTERAGKKVFFFVGNGDNVSSKLKAARFGETTITEFRDMVSDVQTVLPTKPLLMTAEATIADLDDVQDAEKTVEMKRRVARFDIDNDADGPDDTDDTDGTNFTIKKILINRVNQQGYFFENSTRTPAAMKSGKIAEFEFGNNPGENEGETPAVFYTYPTTIGAGKTEISFEGTFFGQDRVYSLVVEQDLQIEANKRYILKAKKIDITKAVFEVSVKEWDSGDDLPSDPNAHTVEMMNLKLEAGSDASFDANAKTLTVSDATKPSVLKFTAKSFTKEGTRVEISYSFGNKTILPITVNNPTPVLTYQAHYEQAYEVTIPVQTIKAPSQALVELVSVKDPRERVAITVGSRPKYAGTNFRPVQVEGIWWAPLNVGATTINGSKTSLSDIGYSYQWGSNKAYRVDSPPTVLVQGPLSATEATTAQNANKFVMGHVTYANDWLTPHNNELWSESNPKGPCPNGWRLPSPDEVAELAKLSGSADVTFTANALKIKSSTANEQLVLPVSARIGNNGTAITTETAGYYWTYKGDNSGYSNYLKIDTGKEITNNPRGLRASALSVRCVLDE